MCACPLVPPLKSVDHFAGAPGPGPGGGEEEVGGGGAEGRGEDTAGGGGQDGGDAEGWVGVVMSLVGGAMMSWLYYVSSLHWSLGGLHVCGDHYGGRAGVCRKEERGLI